MTGESIGPRKASFKEKAVRGVGALAAFAAFYAAGMATYLEVSKAKPAAGISKSEATDIAINEQDAYNAAVSYAADLEKTFNSGGRIANVKVLNGVLEQEYKGNVFIPAVKNPIILSELDSAVAPDKNGNFLNGGWLGIQGVSTNGKITITPMPYDNRTDKIRLYSPNEITIPNISVYETSTESTTGQTGAELIAYALDGNREIANPDGSIVSPGLDLAQK